MQGEANDIEEARGSKRMAILAEKARSSPDTKIDDVGERLEGARKDMRRKIAESLANVTEAALIEKPFGKVFVCKDYFAKIAQGEGRSQTCLDYAEPPPILCKDSARRGQKPNLLGLCRAAAYLMQR